MPKFSILTPFHLHNEDRKQCLSRAVKSVQAQTFSDYEHVLVDDGSLIPAEISLDSHTRLYSIPHQERIIALNTAFEHSSGDWICWLDSDDAFIQTYLSVLSEAIGCYPEYKFFNFGAIIINNDYRVNLWNPFQPARLEVGHEVFGGGTIMAGTFIYHRSIVEELGQFPHHWNPWDFSLQAQAEFPEIKPLFTVSHPDHPEGYPKELGNPWGQDYYLFYKYTRKYHSKVLPTHLYINYRRGERIGWSKDKEKEASQETS